MKPATENRPFRIHLQEELLKRCRKNRGYSLRSFAKALEINPASLSRILRGERPVSPEMRDRLARKLGLEPTEIARLELTESSSQERLEAHRFHQLSLDTFAAISDWYHYAILELLQVSDFEPVPQWVAKKLGITVSEVRAAVERLRRLGLLEVTATGQWRALTNGNTNVGADLRASAYRKLQKQVLEMALQALEETPIDRRDQSSMTMAADSSLLPAAADKITAFRRELCAFLESGKKKDSVFQLSISLYPLTRG